MSEQRSDMDGRPAAELPPQVRAVPEGRLLQYWKERERQHVRDVYAGLRIKKFPEDLRMFEHLLWLSRAQVVVELGTHLGGSALWFRDRLRTLAAYGRVPEDIRVVTVDTAQDRVATLLRNADPYFDKDIVLVEADVTDPGVTEAVSRHVPSGARCLVVEDTAHTYRTTYAALQHLSGLVATGGCFVVEDGIVDVPQLRPEGMPGGVVPAIQDWLTTDQGRAFHVRRDLERYGITSHPHGWLQRIHP
ncbi:class I SAM-dependent methyltransferase [Streptomyces sp. ISL-12]|uniref:CmcI family methyltransferase n=1 Tax=Streptomyces sp. ISL-12 TaxID=2819177 RepID=UPI001BE7ADC7|nr:CmcI family methyltransferase [Streptomyces sp. ISL-12]MBT2415042.1 class I SAM-dependent methyltransferase [Streptomyces sp. ISL-12]